jgi:hypothetical protein
LHHRGASGIQGRGVSENKNSLVIGLNFSFYPYKSDRWDYLDSRNSQGPGKSAIHGEPSQADH